MAIAKLGPRSGHWLALPYFPLERALQIRPKCRFADPMLKALFEIHFGALKLRRSEGKLFALAKGLELVRVLLPGRGDDTKQKSLSDKVSNNLKRSLHWLFDIANNRFNIRHVVSQRGGKSELNPALTTAELLDYEHDADLVMRSVTCSSFDIDPPLFSALSSTPIEATS